MNLQQSLITAALLLGAGPLLLGASPPAGAELQLTLPEAYPAYRQLSFGQNFAQEGGGNNGPIFEEGGDDSDFNLFEYLDINALAGTSSGSSINRSFSYLRLGGQYSVGNLSFYGNLLSSNVTSEINMELDDNAQRERQQCVNPRDYAQLLDPNVRDVVNGAAIFWGPGERDMEITRLEEQDFDNNNCDQRLDQQEKMTYEFELSRTEVDELYLNYTPLDTVSVTAGYNRLTLGQFAFVSPIHMLLPINSEQQLGFSKVDTRVPQPLLQVDFYPIERLQVQAVVIPQSKLDPAQEEYFDTSYRGIGGDYNPVDQLDLNWRDDYDDSQDATEVFAGHQQTLFRALYSPSWGTVGVTAWTGGLHFFIIDNLQIFCGDGSRHYCEDPMDSSGSSPYGYYAEAAPDLAESDAFAIEIAYNAGNWTYIAELVQVQTRSEFSIFTPSASLLRGDEEEMRDAQSFFKTLAEMNQGRTWFDLNYTLLAVGADGRSADGSWTYNLEIFNIATDLKEGDDLLSALGSLPNAFNENWETDQRGQYDDLLFPSFHISKRHTSILGRQADFGVALGFFFQFGGIFSYYNLEINDNFNVQLGLEFIERISENDAATDDNRDYDLVDSMSSALSVAAQIRF